MSRSGIAHTTGKRRPRPRMARRCGAWLVAAALAAAAVPPAGAAEPRLVLRKGDSIAVIGNTLADRMQHAGWLETRIHAAYYSGHYIVDL